MWAEWRAGPELRRPGKRRLIRWSEAHANLPVGPPHERAVSADPSISRERQEQFVREIILWQVGEPGASFRYISHLAFADRPAGGRIEKDPHSQLPTSTLSLFPGHEVHQHSAWGNYTRQNKLVRVAGFLSIVSRTTVEGVAVRPAGQCRSPGPCGAPESQSPYDIEPTVAPSPAWTCVLGRNVRPAALAACAPIPVGSPPLGLPS